MGLIAGQRLATESKPLLQARQGCLVAGSFGIGAKNPVQASLHQLLESSFPLGSGDFGAVEKVVGKINGGFHGQ
jgi:hypothetical protein